MKLVFCFVLGFFTFKSPSESSFATQSGAKVTLAEQVREMYHLTDEDR